MFAWWIPSWGHLNIVLRCNRGWELKILQQMFANFQRQPHIHIHIMLQEPPCALEVQYSQHCNSAICFMQPQIWEMIKSLCFYPCVFWQHLELRWQRKATKSRIASTIWIWKPLRMLDLPLLIVRCPFNKSKMLWWETFSPENCFHWYIAISTLILLRQSHDKILSSV